MSRAQEVYSSMSEAQRKPFSEIQVKLLDRLLHPGVATLKDNVYHWGTYALYDALTTYADYCYQFLKIDEHRWIRNETIENEFGRVANDDAFFYVTLNEPFVHAGVSKLIKQLLETEEQTSLIYTLVYISFPVILSFFYVWNCFTCCFFTRQQKKSLKGFLLIPKEELLRLEKKFGGGGEVENGGKESSSVRADTVRFSLIQQFFLYNCATITLCLIVFITFAILGSVTCDQFVVRNREYDHTLNLEATMNRIHLWTVEVLYRNDSLFWGDEVRQGCETDVNNMLASYKALRFGDEELKLPGNDNEDTAYDIYYRESCDFTDPTLTKFESLECLSMNQKIDYIQVAAHKILQSDLNNTELRKSKEYETIIMIDNFSNGSVFDNGAIKQNFASLKKYIEGKVDAQLSFVNNFSLLLVILFLPALLVFFCCMFRKSATKLNRNLSMTRQVMTHMKKDILMKKDVYDYLVGKTTNSFEKVFKNEKINRMEEYFDIVEMSAYGFIYFDKDLRIIHYNSTADELFRIKASGSKSMRVILTPDSIRLIKKWIGRKLETSFNGELTAVYESQEYPVLCDVSRSKRQIGRYIGVFENMESSKKKDLLKESERRTEKIDLLMRNILPAEIAKQATLEDFEIGKCVVYQHKRATAYFCDICNFSGMSNQTNPETIISMLHNFFSGMDVLCTHYGLEKIKTIGDCYFCVSGIPTYKPLHAVTAMEFAIDAQRFCVLFNKKDNPLENWPLQIRTGISSGKLVAGIVGRVKRVYDIWGPMINEAARMESNGLPGKIQVSRTTYESIFDRFEFLERKVNLQGFGTDVLCHIHTPTQEQLDDNSLVRRLLREMKEEIQLKKSRTSKNDLSMKVSNSQSTIDSTPLTNRSEKTKVEEESLIVDISTSKVEEEEEEEEAKEIDQDETEEEEEEFSEFAKVQLETPMGKQQEEKEEEEKKQEVKTEKDGKKEAKEDDI